MAAMPLYSVRAPQGHTDETHPETRGRFSYDRAPHKDESEQVCVCVENAVCVRVLHYMCAPCFFDFVLGAQEERTRLYMRL